MFHRRPASGVRPASSAKSARPAAVGGRCGRAAAAPPRPPRAPRCLFSARVAGRATVARVTRSRTHACGAPSIVAPALHISTTTRWTQHHTRTARNIYCTPDSGAVPCVNLCEFSFMFYCVTWMPVLRRFTEGITVAAVLGGRLECAGLDTFSARARSDIVPPSEHPAMATETGGAAAGGEQQYSLRWNDFHSSMVSSFRRLRDEEDFVDVTLACAGATFTAHKVVLSACSPYFRRLLKANPCQHPIVILRDVHDKDMESLLRFMYQGEVHIGQEQLKEFLRAAQLLQVRGLTDVPAPAPMTTLDQKASPSASSWTETGSAASREGREGGQQREGRRPRKPDDGANNTPPPKRARSSDLYQAQLKSRTEQLLSAQGASPERLGTNGHELALFGQAMDTSQNPHLSGVSNNLSGDGEESSSDAGASDTEGETRAKQEPIDYDDPATMANTNGTLPHNFPGLLNLPGFPGLPGPSGIPDNYGGCRRTQDLLRVRATDPRPCPKCGKIYRSAHTLRTHLEDKHTVCPGYRLVHRENNITYNRTLGTRSVSRQKDLTGFA
ncbi:unnamed protein product [Spodoptera exigua]|nr:unnamed protein product [Spodoptera exigua]